MLDGIGTSIVSVITGKIINKILNLDKIYRFWYYISNPDIFIVCKCVKKYEYFNHDFNHIKNEIINDIKENSYSPIKNFSKKGPTNHYLDFSCNDTDSIYRIEIQIDLGVNNFENDMEEDMSSVIIIKSLSPAVIKYRDCEKSNNFEIIRYIVDLIEKAYNLNERYTYFELISSSSKKVVYPNKGSYEFFNSCEVICNDNAIAIKSKTHSEIFRCLNEFKLKIFRN